MVGTSGACRYATASEFSLAIVFLGVAVATLALDPTPVLDAGGDQPVSPDQRDQP
jgi:hypothetical protein